MILKYSLCFLTSHSDLWRPDFITSSSIRLYNCQQAQLDKQCNFSVLLGCMLSKVQMTFLGQNDHMQLSPYLYTYSSDHLVGNVDLDSIPLIVYILLMQLKITWVQGIWNGQSNGKMVKQQNGPKGQRSCLKLEAIRQRLAWLFAARAQTRSILLICLYISFNMYRNINYFPRIALTFVSKVRSDNSVCWFSYPFRKNSHNLK